MRTTGLEQDEGLLSRSESCRRARTVTVGIIRMLVSRERSPLTIVAVGSTFSGFRRCEPTEIWSPASSVNRLIAPDTSPLYIGCGAMLACRFNLAGLFVRPRMRAELPGKESRSCPRFVQHM